MALPKTLEGLDPNDEVQLKYVGPVGENAYFPLTGANEDKSVLVSEAPRYLDTGWWVLKRSNRKAAPSKPEPEAELVVEEPEMTAFPEAQPVETALPAEEK